MGWLAMLGVIKMLTAKDIMKALFIILRYHEGGAFIVHKNGQLIGIKKGQGLVSLNALHTSFNFSVRRTTLALPMK